MSPMSPARLPASTPSHDFDWPPQGDVLTVHEVGPDPSRPLPDAPRHAVTARRRPPSPPRSEPPRESRRTIVGVLAVSAIVAGVAAWVLYATLSRPATAPVPVPVPVIHHAAPAATSPVAATVAPRRLTIFATYPVEPAPASVATAPPTGRAVDGTARELATDSPSDPPRLPVDAAPLVSEHIASVGVSVPSAPTASPAPPAAVAPALATGTRAPAPR